ncbi:hypothetical protein [Sphingobium lactosutens]|uniref:Transposase Synechocystis PCC 6803 domain-containing protein n=1 Tax=Sphingobium lactosutens DS20 TaxID=1331060 RepID=T0IT24_9SPHN|nr:hypothetical protein [Sphingobium lactosutens]EQB14995.1 hypothetical protein RLDS_12555 [Sphingobium lactosutens DS20]
MLAAVDGVLPVREAAALFKVSVAYVYKARIRRRLTGDAGRFCASSQPEPSMLLSSASANCLITSRPANVPPSSRPLDINRQCELL